METKLSETCSAPDFFAGLDPSLSAREARALILAAYSEKELAPERAESVRSHLETCSACASFLSDFERSTVPEVACAICPSSELLDRFIFDRQSVPAVEAGRIEAHLRECSLCRSECQWLKHLESAGTTSFRQPAPTWMRPALAAAAVVIIALAAILYSRGAEQTPNSGQLKALAVIKEPAQIDFAELERTSGTPDPATAALYREAVT